MQEKYKITLKTLSPVHIGTGEVLQPLEFYVGKDRIYEINFDLFLENLERVELNTYFNLFKSRSPEIVVESLKFVQEVFPKQILRLKTQKEILKRLIRGQIGIFSEFLGVDFNEVLNKRTRLNQFQIYKTIKNVYFTPYIPGSALKGSIRTAVLNYLNLRKGIKREHLREKRKSLEAEAKILEYSNFSEDPFRHLKISDLRLVSKNYDFATKIYYALNLNKHQKRRGPFQYLECLLSGLTFEGELRLEEDFRGRINFKLIQEALKQFYEKSYLEEKEKVYPQIEKQYGLTVDKDWMRNSHGILIRLGKHSGNEFVTIKSLKTVPTSRTFWVASERKNPEGSLVYPFGWAELIFTKTETGMFPHLKKTS